MENLSLSDNNGPRGLNTQAQSGSSGPQLGPTTAQGPPQLPPQMFTTAAQLLDLTDKKLMLVLRDGRKLIGVLRSWDQFANLVLADTIERYYLPSPHSLYADAKRGTFLVRGENVLLLGEIDLDKDDDVPAPYTEAPLEQVFSIKKEQEAQRKKKDKLRGKKLSALGFEGEHSGEILF
ncbi:putative small nuclear ribonucleoprotein [Phaeomoniella chlamydospora]|uniref:U6 snRNA-associated Sm-like protein LSm1 n=1 Tax=Phaeomoniella chlamydospora TaxID=158046 RepID=A0A0G2EM95_PHACM|nr:putative small nuclear ribonucleoprotein [Phaeomoniella chlamydospora]